MVQMGQFFKGEEIPLPHTTSKLNSPPKVLGRIASFFLNKFPHLLFCSLF